MNNSSTNNFESIRIDTIKNHILSSWGIIYLVFGSIGTLLNLCVFTRRAHWHFSPCIPYLFASTLATIPLMYVSILSRIGIGLQITPFYYIPILCKLQVYISNVSVSLVIWFTIGSCWDRYLSSSRNALTRRMSSLRNTRRTVLIITFCISFAYAQIFYCFEGNLIMAAAPCSPKNTQCSIIDTTLLFVIQFSAPPLIIFYFGINIYLNIRQMKYQRQIPTISITKTTQTRSNQKTDRIILRMVFIQVTLLLICSLPVFAFRLYTTLTLTTAKNSLRRSVENLIFNVTLLIYYFEKVCSFYIYTITSRHFRQILWQFITTIRSENIIVPENKK
ncbi:unnamed protein product [Rotaria sordida]|uniref:G-protein coupled receptors family 1 profile domain-containing protein n=1 Tax=Rotaria sordida TaxID=392033 RepID=A0A814P6Y8_9BILA|nr:unnamed protein product [Rotaria sordida]